MRIVRVRSGFIALLFFVSSEVALPFLGGVVGRRTEFVWFVWCDAGCCLRSRPYKRRGVTYSRSLSGTGMPLQERFQTRPMWACLQTLSRKQKVPVSRGTAAEATQIEFSWFLLHKKYLNLVKPELARLQAPCTTSFGLNRTKVAFKWLELKCQNKSFQFAFGI